MSSRQIFFVNLSISLPHASDKFHLESNSIKSPNSLLGNSGLSVTELTSRDSKVGIGSTLISENSISLSSNSSITSYIGDNRHINKLVNHLLYIDVRRTQSINKLFQHVDLSPLLRTLLPPRSSPPVVVRRYRSSPPPPRSSPPVVARHYRSSPPPPPRSSPPVVARHYRSSPLPLRSSLPVVR